MNDMADTSDKRVASPVDRCESFRVFISYSHSDKKLTDKLVDVLEENGIKTVSDRNFAFGHGFPDQIRSFISHAHVFLPLITEESSRRGWVHQEIGYAMALNVPVLPVCHSRTRSRRKPSGHLPARSGGADEPGEMIRDLQAITITDDVKKSADKLTPSVFANLVSRYEDPALASYTCTEMNEERAAMMEKFSQEAQFAQDALNLSGTGCVRQRGGLSSLHIPDRAVSDPIWKDRNEPADPNDHTVLPNPGGYHCKLQRRERLALEKHARQSGCKLIINNIYEHLSEPAQILRLQCLIDFLVSMDGLNADVTVAYNENLDRTTNTAMVGDWFLAESVSMGGPRQTNFTTHAPNIRTRIEMFDREMEQLLKESGWEAADSRVAAIDRLQQEIKNLGG